VKRAGTTWNMSTPPLKKLEIDGVAYYLASDVARAVGVSRQTLWRWRNAGYIPKGHRRRRQVLYNAAEIDTIRKYANWLEPADVTSHIEPSR
jgi:transposase-like protein